MFNDDGKIKNKDNILVVTKDSLPSNKQDEEAFNKNDKGFY